MEEWRRGPDDSERSEPAEAGASGDAPGTEADPPDAPARGRDAEHFPTRGVAPSSPDLAHLERLEPSEEAKSHEPSPNDAMGKDKRREVIGHSYGPSRRSQVLAFGGFFAVVAIFLIGGKMLADKADEPPKTNPDVAPWSAPDAPQAPAVRPQ